MSKEPFQFEVPEDWAKELLAHTPDGDTQDIWTRIEKHREGLQQAVKDANAYLAESILAKLVCSKIAEENLVGPVGGVLVVAPDGSMWMQTGGKQRPVMITRPGDEPLPTIDKLRRMAAELKLDISHLGRKKKKIWAMIKEERGRQAALGIDEAVTALKEAKPTKAEKPKKKRIKTGDAVPIQTVKPEDTDLKKKTDPKPPEKEPDPPKGEEKKSGSPDNGQKKTSLSLLSDQAKDKKLSDVEAVETATEGLDIDDLLDLNG